MTNHRSRSDNPAALRVNMFPLRKGQIGRVLFFFILLLWVIPFTTTAGGVPKHPQEDSSVRRDTIIARVLGRDVGVSDTPNLPGIIASGLLAAFAAEEHVQVTEQEIEQCTHSRQDMMIQRKRALVNQEKELSRKLSAKGLAGKDRAKTEEELNAVRSLLKDASPPSLKDSSAMRIEREISRSMVRIWKINLLLYRRFGGRAVYQQAGIEPLDAYRDFLRDQERKGNFVILDQELAQRFWRYFDDSIHTFVPAEETKSALENPWWYPGRVH